MQASRDPPGRRPSGEIANPLTISRENFLQGISAGFRQFPPDRAVVKKAAIAEGLEISAFSGISADGFAVSAKARAPLTRRHGACIPPAASRAAARSPVTAGSVALRALSSRARLGCSGLWRARRPGPVIRCS
jgi:hypothetical protein